jgi:hypothetical protein
MCEGCTEERALENTSNGVAQNGRPNFHGARAQTFHLSDAAPLAKTECRSFLSGRCDHREGFALVHIHEAADWIRHYTQKALAELTAVNADGALSSIGKAKKKKLLAAQAQANIEGSSAVALSQGSFGTPVGQMG